MGLIKNLFVIFSNNKAPRRFPEFFQFRLHALLKFQNLLIGKLSHKFRHKNVFIQHRFCSLRFQIDQQPSLSFFKFSCLNPNDVP